MLAHSERCLHAWHSIKFTVVALSPAATVTHQPEFDVTAYLKRSLCMCVCVFVCVCVGWWAGGGGAHFCCTYNNSRARL
jgi:hypothetical protein